MICGQSSCNCAFSSESLTISNDAGVISIETNAFAIVTSSTRPASPFANQFIYETDTGLSYRYSGSAWQLFAWTVEPSVKLTIASQSIASGVTTGILAYDTEVFDPFGWHSGGNPTRVTPLLPGYYQMWCGGTSTTSDTDWTRLQNACLKNGTQLLTDDVFSPSGASATPGKFSIFDEISMNGTTDYLEHRIIQSNTSADARAFAAQCVVRWMRGL